MSLALPFMKVFPMLALLATLGSAIAARPTNVLAEEGPLALAPGEGVKLFKQCSRPAPTPDGPTWEPSA